MSSSWAKAMCTCAVWMVELPPVASGQTVWRGINRAEWIQKLTAGLNLYKYNFIHSYYTYFHMRTTVEAIIKD